MTICEPHYATSGDAAAGLRVARALTELGRLDEAAVRCEQLAALPGARGGASLQLGRVRERQARADDALAAYEEALARDEPVAPADASRDAHALAGLHWKAGRHGRALEAAERARVLAVSAGDRKMQGYATLALGDIRAEVGDADGAEVALREAGTLWGSENPRDTAYVRLKAGVLAVETGHPAAATADLREALALARASGRRDVERGAHLYLGVCARALGDSKAAASEVAAAAALTSHADGPVVAVSICYNQALGAADAGDEIAVSRALDCAEAAGPVPEFDWRVAFERSRQHRRQGDVEGAIRALGRAVTTLETMRQGLVAGELKAWFLEAKRAPFEALFHLHAEAGRADAAVEVAERTLSRTLTDAFIAASRGAHAADGLARLAKVLPDMNALPHARPMSAPQLAQALAGLRAMVFFQAEGTVWRMTFPGTGRTLFDLRRLPGPALAFAQGADAARTSPDDLGASDALGRLLFPPNLPTDLPPPGVTLHVVLHDPLARLPLAAWRTGGGWLVARNPLVFTPSLTVLAAIRGRPAPPTSGPPLVLGDPEGNLPGAAAEASAVAAHLGVAAYLGAAASGRQVRDHSNASLLHLATHAGADLRQGTFRLADGPLRPSDILALGTRPRLVVLSSCASGLSRGADSLFVPATLMLAAGARTALATLRSVDDSSARDFILDFYRAGGAVAPADALARTQAKWSSGRAPSSWTSFQLYGLGESP